MSKVYVVTTGCYSAYHIRGIFSSREKADEIVAINEQSVGADGEYDREGYEQADVEEWELDSLDPHMISFFVRMNRDGTTDEVTEQAILAHADEDFPHPTFGGGRGLPRPLIAYVRARDAQHAVKIVNERRSELLALDRWPTE